MLIPQIPSLLLLWEKEFTTLPMWLIILSDQLLIIALPFPAVVPLPRAGSYALLTRPPLETPLPIRFACVKHAASVHPEPGSNSP
ncbi:unnamed protein product [Victoria cruziana]